MTNAEIDAFLMVYQHRTISKAAERLFISQSALSTRLKNLETELGGTLFHREKGQRSVSPTEIGHRFFDLAVRYRDLTGEMYRLCRDDAEKRLRISCLNSVGYYLFTTVYERFLERMPQIALEMQDLTTQQAYYHVERGQTDLAFTPGLYTSKNVQAKPVFSEKLVPICAEETDLPDTVDLRDLDPADEVYIGWSNEYELWHRRTFGERCIPRIQMELTGQLPLFLRQPGRWALVPAIIAHELHHLGGFRRLRSRFSPPERTTYCMQIDSPVGRGQKKCFFDCLRDVLSELDDPDVRLYF